MKKYIILVLSVVVSTGLYSQNKTDNIITNAENETFLVVKNNGETLYLDKDRGCNGIKPILDNKGDTAYLLMSKKVFSSKPLLKSSVQIEAKTPKELANQLESYKKKGYFVKEMYEENSVYHILFMKKE